MIWRIIVGVGDMLFWLNKSNREFSTIRRVELKFKDVHDIDSPTARKMFRWKIALKSMGLLNI